MKFIPAVILAMAVALPAEAELFRNLKVGGSIDFQANSAKNTRDFNARLDDRVGDAVTRVLLDLDWDLLDDMHAVLTLRKNDRSWGTTGNGGQKGDGSQPIVASGVDVLGTVFVSQAYLRLDKMIGQFDVRIGRQFLGEPGDLVLYFGPKRDYGLWATSLDAFRLDWGGDALTFSGIAAKADGGSAIATVAGTETDIRGVDLGVKSIPCSRLNAFAYNRVMHKGNGAGTLMIANDYLWIFGLKGKVEAAGAWLSFEAAMNAGTDRSDTIKNRSGAGTTAVPMNYTGRAGLVEAGYKADIPNVGALTPWASFGAGTGRMSDYENKQQGFTAIEPDYAPGIINGRFNGFSSLNMTTVSGTKSLSTVGLNNRIVSGGGIRFSPSMAEKLVAGLSFWNYRFQTATDGNADFNDGNNKGCKNRNIGSEVGATIGWKHSENVSYGAGYARFLPGGYIRNLNTKNAQNLNAAELAFADLTLKF